MQYVICPRCKFKVPLHRHLCTTCGYKLPSLEDARKASGAAQTGNGRAARAGLWQQFLGLAGAEAKHPEPKHEGTALGEV